MKIDESGVLIILTRIKHKKDLTFGFLFIIFACPNYIDSIKAIKYFKGFPNDQ
jgi:hypothetical protein